MASRELNILVAAKGALKAARDIGTVNSKVKGLSSSVGRAGKVLGVGLVAGAGAGILLLQRNIDAGIASLRELEQVENLTAAAIESTGGKAGVTAAQVRALAEAQEDLTTVDDKTVQAGENMLLTFTNIGGDIFPMATKAMVDMGVAMNNGSAEGLDLSKTAILIGKALNDPIKGVTALRKNGVMLTEQQTKDIKSLVKQGKLREAQVIILKELGVEFGKAGEAAGKGAGAAQRRFSDAVEGAQQALATGLIPVIEEVQKEMTGLLSDQGNLDAIKGFGQGLAGAFREGVAFAKQIPWGSIADAMKLAGTGAKAALDFFTGLPPWVQTAVVTGWGLNKLTGGALSSVVGALGSGLIKGVLGMTAGVVNINAGVVNGAGGVPGKGGGLGLIGGIIPAAAILGIGYLIGQGITDAMGGPTAGTPNEGRGRPIGDTGWTFGQHPGALVRQEDERRRNIGNLANRGLGNAQTNAGDLGARGLGNRSAQTALEGQVLQRATAAGFKPSADQITRTANATAARQIAASRSASDAALLTAQATRDGTNRIVAALQALRIPPPTITVSAGDIQSRVVTRNRTVKPHGSRDSVVSGPGASGV